MTVGQVSRVSESAPSPTTAQELRIGLVCSGGGHLAQLKALSPWWQNHDRFWVTFDLPGGDTDLSGDRAYWAHYPTTRSLVNLCRNTVLAWKCLRRERPDVLVSCGAGVAVPFFLIGRLLRIPTVYVEVYDRIDSASLTGRVCYRFSSLFLVQWEDQLRFYPDGVVIGPLV
jgi:UDP-N-acetylglucosamine:LPS N-acetylglucosamine transferase